MIVSALVCCCGAAVHVAETVNGWQVVCLDCYDATDDAGERAHVAGRGSTREAAEWDWQEQHDDAWGVEWVPRARPANERTRIMFASLERQINTEAARQRATRTSNDNATGAQRKQG